MRDLYKALAHLTLDEALLVAIGSLPNKTITIPAYGRGAVVPDPKFPNDLTKDFDLHWEIQPSDTVIVKVNTWLRQRGLYLAAYELGEIVRLAGLPGFFDKLAELGEFFAAEGIAIGNVTPRDLVLIGALLVDKAARARLRSETLDKEWFGYDGGYILDIQTRLQRVFPEGLKGDPVADAIYSMGWSPEVCIVAQERYTGMFHLNV